MKIINARLFALAIILFISHLPLQALEFRAGSATGATSTQVIVPVRVFDFDSLLSCQGSLQFDVTVVNYNTIQQFGLPGMTLASFGLTQVGVGNLSYLWDDGTLTGVSVADSTIIFEIVFDVVGAAGQQSAICFGDVPTGREVIDIGFNEVTPTYTCGSVQIPGGANPVATLSVTDVTCFGASNGTASVSVTGGVAPYSYSWSTGATSQAVIGLPPGPVSVTVTDANSGTDAASDTITQPSSALNITGITSTPETGCGSSDGTASATVSGGTPAYTYSWSNGDSDSTITGLIGGSYTLTVTDSKGCADTDNVTVGSSSSSLTASITPTHVSCFNGSNGSATVTASSGTSPYSYSWTTGSTSATITNLTAGTYSVTVEDQGNCQTSASVTISEPASALSITGITSTPETGCGASDGTASAAVSGGTPAYTYSWSNGDSDSTITGLIGGSYTLTVTDSNGCADTGNVTVGSSSSLSASIAPVHVSCFNGSNGSATVTASSGTSPYSYSWTTGSTSATISNLPAGTYSATVEDANGCSASETTTINQPAQITIATTVNDITCFGAADGSASANASGGTGSLTYSWSTGATTSSITSQGPGSPAVTVTDDNGCTAAASVTFTDPPQLTATASLVSAVSCFGGNNGSALVTASGGTPAYIYAWTGGSTSASPNNLTAGNKSVTVTDNHGCTATASVNVTQPAAALSASATATAASTAGGSDGSVALTVSGGTVNYSYSWSNGATTEDISGLAADTYTVVVTDANSCTATASATVADGPSSVFDLKPKETISIFPNPNNGSFEVEINNREQLSELKVLNQLGQVVYSMDLSNWNHAGSRISVKTELQEGIYIVQLVARDNSVKTGTLSVEY